MRDYRLKRICNVHFSVRFLAIAKTYGFKTVGKFENFLNQVESPNVKLCYRTIYVRVSKLLREINEYKAHVERANELEQASIEL